MLLMGTPVYCVIVCECDTVISAGPKALSFSLLSSFSESFTAIFTYIINIFLTTVLKNSICYLFEYAPGLPYLQP